MKKLLGTLAMLTIAAQASAAEMITKPIDTIRAAGNTATLSTTMPFTESVEYFYDQLDACYYLNSRVFKQVDRKAETVTFFGGSDSINFGAMQPNHWFVIDVHNGEISIYTKKANQLKNLKGNMERWITGDRGCDN